MFRARARLTLHGEIAPSRFGEVGRPYLIRRRDDGRAVALCSAFDLLYWPGRATYEGHASVSASLTSSLAIRTLSELGAPSLRSELGLDEDAVGAVCTD